MKYNPKLEKCPYKQTNGNKCSHKAQGKFCPYNSKKKCQLYNEWDKERKYHTDAPDAYMDDINIGVRV